MSTWASRIRDLRKAGMTLRQIGEAIGLATSSVSDLAHGRTAEPRGKAALELYSLHQRVCGQNTQRQAASS